MAGRFGAEPQVLGERILGHQLRGERGRSSGIRSTARKRASAPSIGAVQPLDVTSPTIEYAGTSTVAASSDLATVVNASRIHRSAHGASSGRSRAVSQNARNS